MIPAIITNGLGVWSGVQYVPTMGFLGAAPVSIATPNIWYPEGRDLVWEPVGRGIMWEPDGRDTLWAPPGRN